MGLDQYAFTLEGESKTEGIAEWRKHNRLQGWMENLWVKKDDGNQITEDDPFVFSGVEFELVAEDIDNLEKAIMGINLPETEGFFFGPDSYLCYDDEGTTLPASEYGYKEEDLSFIKKAREALAKGKKVFYGCDF
jgi:hypothetical protein